MPKTVRYHCRNCGNDFDIEVLTQEERRRADEEGRPVYKIGCPRCKRTDVDPLRG
jgi:transposase-like protein